MAEYKGKLLNGLFSRAKNCIMSDGATSVEDIMLRRVYKNTIDTGTIAGGGQGNQSVNIGENYSNPTIIINGTSNRLLYAYVLSGSTLTIYYRNVTSDSGSSTISIDILIDGSSL